MLVLYYVAWFNIGLIFLEEVVIDAHSSSYCEEYEEYNKFF